MTTKYFALLEKEISGAGASASDKGGI